MTTEHQPEDPALRDPVATLLHFAAEAHRRKWAFAEYDSAAFSVLDCIGNELRAAYDAAQSAAETPDAESPAPVPAALDLTSASAHITAAAEALGMPRCDPGDDRETARRIRYARPGVPLQHALASVQALRAMGWGPGTEAAEAKLAEIRSLIEAGWPGVLPDASGQAIPRILAIIGSEEGAGNGC